jgi:transposase-like protein
MTRGVAHPPEFRAQVVAAVLAGESISEVARRFGVDKSSVIRWAAAMQPVEPTVARTREALSELIWDAVAETLKSLIARAAVTGQADWIEKQSAADLAQLGATEWDRIIRMVSGFRPVDDEPDGLPEPAAAAPGAGADDR